MAAPSAVPKLVERKAGTFVNWHETVRAPYAARFELLNPQASPSLTGLRATSRELQALCVRARSEGVRLRALGAGWSFSDAAATDGWQLNTAYLNWVFRLDPHFVTPDWSTRTAGLVLAQCGLSIHELNSYLERDKLRSLRTSGASNGQTIAGAISTDTHGSAIDQGPLASQVVGMHFITATRQLWIEPASAPVVSDAFLASLGLEPVRDDAAFHAALVGLGGFGILHGVLLDTAPRFKLRARQKQVPYDAALRAAMNTLEFGGLGYAQRPYFFQVIVNPHAAKPEAYVKAMDAIPCPPDYRPDYAISAKSVVGYDVPGIVGKLLDAAPSLTPAVARTLVKSQLKEFDGKMGTWGEIFDFTTPRAKSAGAALGVPLARCSDALDLAQAAFDDIGGAPMVFACRYVARSPALLSIAPFSPVTAVIDLDGVYSKRTLRVIERVRQRFEAAALPFTQHWGKLNELTPARVRASHGANVDEWRRVRRMLLGPSERRLFASAMLERAGLHEA